MHSAKPSQLLVARFRGAIVAALAATFVGMAYAAGEAPPAWPAKVVTFEELRPLTALKLKVPGLVEKGRVIGPSSLRVHVDSSGTVVKAALLESCGNGDLDEAAIHAMRAMKFSPYTTAGVPTEVTLVVPVHVPKNLGRSR